MKASRSKNDVLTNGTPNHQPKTKRARISWKSTASDEDEERLLQHGPADEDQVTSETESATELDQDDGSQSSPKPSSFSSLPSLDYGQELSPDEETRLTITAYQVQPFRILVFNVFSCSTLGLGFLLGRWFPRWKLLVTCTVCSLNTGQRILVENSWGEEDVIDIVESSWNGPLSDAFPSTAPPPIAPRGTISSDLDPSMPTIRMFDYRYWRFVYNPIFGQYECISNWTDPVWTVPSETLKGLSDDGFLKRRQKLFGWNSVDVEEPSWMKLLFDEVLHPFFVFQIFSIILWSYDDYYIYAACIFLISAISVFTTLVETKKSIKRMREMSRFSVSVRLWRNGGWLDARSEDMLPGDIFEIPQSGMNIFPCDALLLKGECIVNEALLTGESVPVAKLPTISPTSLESNQSQLVSMLSDGIDPTRDPVLAKSFLFSGTKVIRVRLQRRDIEEPRGALGFVVKTGFYTTKGGLVRAMLYPKPHKKFQFYEDAFKFIAFLFGIACIGFLVSLYNFVQMGVPWDIIFVRALDLVTIVVPPALPATMTIGTSFALARLRRWGIYCIAPSRINIGGKLEVLCFDKTDDQVRFGGSWERVEDAVADSLEALTSYDADDSELDGITPGFPYPPLVCVAAVCHSIKIIDGILSGDPLDLQMFEYTRFRLDEGGSSASNRRTSLNGIPIAAVIRPPSSTSGPKSPSRGDTTSQDLSELYNTEFGVVRIFEFDAGLRRAAVVVKRFRYRGRRDSLDGQESEPGFEAFVKGAPEVIRAICRPESVPDNYDFQLADHARRGHRVIACAWRRLHSTTTGFDAATCKREEVECALTFAGFALFENRPKDGTTPVMKALFASHLRTVMCTGDNAGTAIAVAREVELIPPNCIVFVSRLIPGDSTLTSHVSWELVPGGDDIRLGTAGRFDLDPITFKLKVSNIGQTLLEPGHSRSRTTSISSWQSSLRNISIGGRASMDGLLGQAPPQRSYTYALAVTGDVFQWMLEFASKERMDRLLVKCQIFARMSPDQKQIMVERLQDIGYCTGFIGDGANDCGALRAADVGISLSEAEASVAAPLTSKSPDLACVLQVVREGRAALVTSFGLFKFMALYSLVQFSSVCLMYTFSANLGDVQYMYIDLILILPVAVFMGRSGPSKSISPRRPTASLTSKKVLTSLVGQVALQVIGQVYVFLWVRRQPWYLPPRYFAGDYDKIVGCYENTVVFLVSSFQYLTMAAVFTRGPPFREPIWRNVPLLLLLLSLFALNTLLVMAPPEFLAYQLELENLPYQGRVYILGVVAISSVSSWIGERWAFPFIAKWIARGADFLVAVTQKSKGGRKELKIEKWRRRDERISEETRNSKTYTRHT
ncbi:hypothetical protein SmJEL517_g04851 [Synchytrium microbalum]|uniref:Cation-transporting ATPase n=1 Tax=Synchytrium microbalum TaxID=1806994 RepID=A0A507BYG6_9FUNG|nr:uncharacterized protein SmJEL517_g04851 [Synchytrium microbalum]TPX31909.1 hypothetical protein SmJEL517_g04851 [Synchytrium microbalum]